MGLNIFQNCSATLKQAVLLKPQNDYTLEELCHFGFDRLNLPKTQEYLDRLNFELDVIQTKGYVDYFLIFADFMAWANKEMLMGPGRGSSAGSLVAYLTGITNVDPIKHKLLFFRFLDINSNALPDVDIDSENRDAIIDYLVNKYGIERVAKLGTTGRWQKNNSINEFAKALEISRFEFDKFLSSIPSYAANDDRNDTALAIALEQTSEGKKLLQKYPEIAVIANVINMPSNSATHASGVILTDKHISNYVSVNSDTNTANIDLNDAEKIGLLKLDILGLNTLEILATAIRMAGKDHSFFSTISLDDPEVFSVSNSGKFLGIFQIDGQAATQFARKVKLESLEDVASLLSIARPGPMESGAAESWIKRKTKEEEITYLHPKLESYLKDTMGLLIYQESIMQIANGIAGMPWPEVTKLRKTIGKSKGEEAVAKFKETFVEGCLKSEFTQVQAEALWKEIVGFGKYGFSRNHAIPYAVIAYWTMYVKKYYPLEFAAATLTIKKETETQLRMLRELAKEGIDYTPVDPELSTDKWTVKAGRLIGPLQNIIGLKPKNVTEILSARSRQEPLKESLQKKLDNAKTKLDCLFPLRDYLLTIDMQKHITGNLTTLENAKPNGDWQEGIYVCGIVQSITERDENEERRVADRIARGQQGIKTGFTKFIEIRLKDDTLSNYYAKVGPKEYDTFLGLTERCVADKTVLVVKGVLTPNAPVLLVKNAKIIGEV